MKIVKRLIYMAVFVRGSQTDIERRECCTKKKGVIAETAETTCEEEGEKDENRTGRRKRRGGSRARGRDACSTA